MSPVQTHVCRQYGIIPENSAQEFLYYIGHHLVLVFSVFVFLGMLRVHAQSYGVTATLYYFTLNSWTVPYRKLTGETSYHLLWLISQQRSVSPGMQEWLHTVYRSTRICPEGMKSGLKIHTLRLKNCSLTNLSWRQDLLWVRYLSPSENTESFQNR